MPPENSEQTKRILNLLSDGVNPAKIAKLLKISQPALHKKLKRLEQKSMVKLLRTYPRSYVVTPAGRELNHADSMVKLFPKKPKTSDVKKPLSLPVRKTSQKEPFFQPSINFHDFKVKLPISQKGREIRGGKKVELNNWMAENFHITLPVKLTLTLTTRSAILHYASRELPRNASFYTEFLKWFVMGIDGASSFLASHGWRVEKHRAKIISQHIAQKTAERVDKEIPPRTVIEIDLNRKAQSLTGNMEQNGRAWMDKSRNIAEAETNDMLYEQKLLAMPELVYQLAMDYSYLAKTTADFRENLESHLEIMRKISKSLDRFLRAIEDRKMP